MVTEGRGEGPVISAFSAEKANQGAAHQHEEGYFRGEDDTLVR